MVQNRFGSNAARQSGRPSQKRRITGVRQMRDCGRKRAGLGVRLLFEPENRNGRWFGSPEVKCANGAIIGVVTLVVQVGSGVSVVCMAHLPGVVVVVQQQMVAALQHQRCQKDKAQQSGFDSCL